MVNILILVLSSVQDIEVEFSRFTLNHPNHSVSEHGDVGPHSADTQAVRVRKKLTGHPLSTHRDERSRGR